MSDSLGLAQPQRSTLAQLTAGRYFVIPDYQRHYAWTERQCLELFEDCVLTARNGERERFMSTITTIAPVGNSVHPVLRDERYADLRPLLVVDGQQRLTSVLILISCICRQLLQSSPQDPAARGAYAAYVRTPLSDGGSVLRVIPQAIPAFPNLMRQHFEHVLEFAPERNGEPPPIVIPAQRRMMEARRVFEEGLQRMERLPSDQRVPLPELLGCVTSRLIFILITLADVGQAGDVFEGLNNRGLGLSALENLKAFAIYAVQSFRRAEALPNGELGSASDLNHRFNDAVGEIYHMLDRVALPDDTARDLLAAAWPLVATRVERAALSKGAEGTPEAIDRERPVDGIRRCLHIPAAKTGPQQAALLGALQFLVCDRLVPASGYFADARRPMNPLSFEEVRLPEAEEAELRGLHLRLAEMQTSAPFLPLLLAHRTVRRGAAEEYLLLARLAERAAFWAYVLGGRNRGAGQKLLAQLARRFVDRGLEFEDLLLGLRGFAVTEGRSTHVSPDLDDWPDLAARVKTSLDGGETPAWAAFAYEWQLPRGVDLPSYGAFVRAHQEGRALRLLPTGGRGRLPADYEATRPEMNHPGNIIITRRMPRLSPTERAEFNALDYGSKRPRLKEFGYTVKLPAPTLTRQWAENRRAEIGRLAIARWAIPENGKVEEATWSKVPPDFADEEIEAPDVE